MIDLTSAQNALKEAYLSAACNQLNTRTNPLFAKIKQSSSDVYGKEIIKVAPFGLNGGIGAGSETGELPTANQNNYVQFKTTLKNLYGTIEISDKAVRASASNSGAFVDLLSAEMEGLLSSSKFNLGRMLYGDGSGLVATVTSVAGSVADVDSVKNLIEGMVVDAIATNEDIETLRIKYVDRANKKVHFTSTTTKVDEGTKLYVQGSKDHEITGLGAIFNSEIEELYGLKKADNLWLTPYTKKVGAEISDEVLQEAIDTLEENTGSNINFITCGAKVKRLYQNYLATYRRNIDVTELEGGYKAISFNGIPVVSDRFVDDDTLYMLDTDKFTLHQLCDWEWIEGEGGKILRQKAGYPAYTATLVKYADLICDQPNGQAKLTGIGVE